MRPKIGLDMDQTDWGWSWDLKKCLKSQCNVKRLITISKKNTPLDKKIAALKQEGKGIGLIASVALPFLLSLFQGRK